MRLRICELLAVILFSASVYSNLLSDPLVRNLHSDRKFDEVLTAAHNCRTAIQPTGNTQNH
jgi:hypothetical protein